MTSTREGAEPMQDAMRNHLARVEDLMTLHTLGLIDYEEAGRDARGARTYVFQAAGKRFEVGVKQIDAWLEGFRTRALIQHPGGQADSHEGAEPGQPPAESASAGSRTS